MSWWASSGSRTNAAGFHLQAAARSPCIAETAERVSPQPGQWTSKMRRDQQTIGIATSTTGTNTSSPSIRSVAAAASVARQRRAITACSRAAELTAAELASVEVFVATVRGVGDVIYRHVGEERFGAAASRRLQNGYANRSRSLKWNLPSLPP